MDETATMELTETGEPEVEAPSLTETASETEDTETGDEEQAETFTPEQVEERVKAAVAEREAEQLATWEAQQFTQQRSDTQRFIQEEGVKNLRSLVAWAHKQGEEGKDLPAINPGALEQIAKPLRGYVAFTELEAYRAHFDKWADREFKGWSVPREIQTELERAVAAGDTDRAFQARYKAIASALESKLKPEIEAKVRAELTEKNTVAGKVTKAKEADANRPQRPTAIGGTALGGARMTLAEIEAEPMDVWTSRPQAEREQLLAEAHEAADKRRR